MARRTQTLTPEIEAHALRSLYSRWTYNNGRYFERRLRPPVLDFGERSLWRREGRELLIERGLILGQPFSLVQEVLLLQQVHQHVDEVMGLTDQPRHGEAFRRFCERPGVRMALVLTFGRPDILGGAARTEEEERLMQRITRLLALAESPNPHEAESAMSEAQRLMLKYNLGLDLQADPSAQRYGVRHLGQPRLRLSEAHYTMSSLLKHHFFVETTWAVTYDPVRDDEAWVLEICGTPANLEMAAYVHDFIWDTAERLWAQHSRAEGVSGHDRAAYFAGLLDGFRERLGEQRQVDQAKGLVWRGDPGLRAFFRERHPPVMGGTSYYTGGASWNAARAAGTAAGRNISLRRPVGEGAAKGGTKGHLRG